MNKEKQIEKLAKILCNSYGDKECYRDCPNSDCFAEICAENLYSHGCRKHEWISVEDRLPDWRDGEVLVFTKYGFSICKRTTSNRWQGKHANWTTHWMPLPTPPTEKEN